MRKSILYRIYAALGVRVMNIYRRNPVRSAYIAMRRRQHMEAVRAGASARAVVFITPNLNTVSGGIMAIINLAKESAKLRELHGADVFVCSYPGNPPLLKYTKFVNDRIVLDFFSLCAALPAGIEILVHIPEVFTARFVDRTSPLLAAGRHRWRFNILLQNIDLIPRREAIEALSVFGAVTATTAHYAYSGARTREALGCPLHHLTAWTSLTPYEIRPFSQKKNIVVVSPDEHEKKKAVLAGLKLALPEFRFITITRMTYPAYRELIASAKFSLTFGEGFDAYFSETTFCGGVGCAVYNDRFFTEDFADLPFVYASWDELAGRLPGDMRAANAPGILESHSARAREVLERYSSLEIMLVNLRAYYSLYFRAGAPDAA